MRDESWVIVDTETSGLYEPIYAVEIAAQRMKGWKRDGEPFRVLLNHDVPIEPAAESLHGYSRAFLRKHGQQPHRAHQAWNQYAGNLPLVAYNLSFDWNRVLEPEYLRIGVPPTGNRGFCAMTLSRRVIQGTANYKLETLKHHFALADSRSHEALNDVVTLALLFEQVLAPKLYGAGLVGLESISQFAKKTPVAACLEHINGVGEPIWYFLDAENVAQGPYPASTIRQLLTAGNMSVWREGMTSWINAGDLPDFAPPVKKRKRTPKQKATPKSQLKTPATTTSSKPSHDLQMQWVNELVGVCKGILADGIINTEELIALHNWLAACPVSHIYPISAVAEIVEIITEDGIVTADELVVLKDSLEMLSTI